MQVLEGEPSGAPKQSWCFWSTTETIQNEVPSFTAILETLIAVPLYWWIALHIGVVQPLLISVIVAPLVLLRSEESVALGLRWFLRFEENTDVVDMSTIGLRFWAATTLCAVVAWILTWLIISHFWGLLDNLPLGAQILITCIFSMFAGITIFYSLCVVSSIFLSEMAMFFFRKVWTILGITVGMFVITTIIRVAATVVHLRQGIKSLPRNFRRITVCTSPAQIPELVPGIEQTSSDLRFTEYLGIALEHPKFIYLEDFPGLVLGAMLFIPVWLYRVTIKSTAWFWWPLAFLGDDLQKARNPALIRWDVMGSLWAKTSIALACVSLLAFAAVNLVFDGAVFQRNPLLTPLGYLLLVDWTLRPWQVCALAGSVLSIVLVFWLDYVSGKYRIGQEMHDAEHCRRNASRF